MRHRISRGFGLVEIMIAIVLGLFLLIGLYTMLTSSQQSYALGRANSSLGGSGQRVTQLIWNQLNQAGFVNYQRRLLNASLPSGGVWHKNQSVRGENDLAIAGVLASTDRLSLRFTGSSVGDNDPTQSSNQTSDGRMFDCNGGAVPNTQIVVVTLFVNTNGELRCQDSRGNSVVMERNIESLQFRYRVGTSDAFVTANNVAAADWSNVVAVEFSLLVAMPSGQGVQALAKSYQVLDKSIAVAADRNLRQVLNGSITIKNLSVDG